MMRTAKGFVGALGALVMCCVGAQARAQGLVVDDVGNVGIGTETPAATLQVEGDALVSSSSGGRLLTLSTSSTACRMALVSSNANWILANQATQKFRIREESSGIAFELTPGGDLTLSGSVTALSFNPVSSRALKTDIEPVDDREILNRVATMPVYRWRYDADPTGERHIGPMAEDFRDTFHIGDGSHLSLVTTTGVSLAAIRGLYEMLEEKDAKLSALQTANDQLARRLAALEQQIGKPH